MPKSSYRRIRENQTKNYHLTILISNQEMKEFRGLFRTAKHNDKKEMFNNFLHTMTNYDEILNSIFFDHLIHRIKYELKRELENILL